MEMERKDCFHKVDKLIERHAWISSEKHLFGRGGTDYDFVSCDPSKARVAVFIHLVCWSLIGFLYLFKSLPIFLDKLVPPWAVILLSVTLILMFGEVVFFEVQILPQATCTRYGSTVRATVAPFVQLLLWLFFPVAYPISKILD